jgi:ribonuclease P protein component
MLAKKYRLPIQSVIGKNGRAVKTPFFLIKIFPNQLLYSRAGAVISKKFSAKATARNKLKRIIFSELPPLLKSTSGQDFLIIVNPKIKDLDQKKIAVHLREVFDKLR